MSSFEPLTPSAVDSKWNPEARIGSEVDKYRIVRLLGKGGMGAVYEARHARLSRRVAVKFLLPHFAAHPEVLKRFENEAQAAGGLEHPNVAAVTDLGRAHDGSPYLVMEYLQGQDCASLLAQQGPLPAARAANIVMQACRGLQAAHRAGIVHRDLKPENLFVTQAGDGSDWVKVLDFGIAKLRPTDASVLTGTGVTMGTAFYMSPEQARGAAQVDERTDVWSLGVVLYELLTTHKPFSGEQFLHIIHQILSVDPPPLSELAPQLDPGLVLVVERAMHKELERRWASVEHLADALAPYTGLSLTPSQPPLNDDACLAETQASSASTVGGVAIGDSAGSVPVQGDGRPDANGPSRAKSVVKIGMALALVGSVLLVGATLVWPSRDQPSDEGSTPAAIALPAAREGVLEDLATTGQPSVDSPSVDAPTVVGRSPSSELIPDEALTTVAPASSAQPTAHQPADSPARTAPVPSASRVLSASPTRPFEHPSSNRENGSNTPANASNSSPNGSKGQIAAGGPTPSAEHAVTSTPSSRAAGPTKPAIEIESDNPYDH